MKKFLEFSTEVEEAKNNSPIVALESTIISHGMPYPQNIEMAKKVEQIIRDNGATHRYYCHNGWENKIGLNENDLETLANSPNVAKVSRRDLAEIVATKKLGLQLLLLL